MKKYLVINKKTKEVCGKFASKSEAADEMMDFINEHNDELDSDDEEYLTPFDFTLDEIESKEINEVVTTYEEAREYLGGKPNADFTVVKKILSGNQVKLDDVANLVSEVNPSTLKPLSLATDFAPSRKHGIKKMISPRIFQTEIKISGFRGLCIPMMLRGSCLRLRLIRLRVRLRISVLGFASKHPNVPANSENSSLTCGMIFCYSDN